MKGLKIEVMDEILDIPVLLYEDPCRYWTAMPQLIWPYVMHCLIEDAPGVFQVVLMEQYQKVRQIVFGSPQN
jgi:hypothetical protein